jgi:hypothetical protein
MGGDMDLAYRRRDCTDLEKGYLRLKGKQGGGRALKNINRGKKDISG